MNRAIFQQQYSGFLKRIRHCSNKKFYKEK
jgi:hypothetical protein